jgi:hypothetical protein
MGTMYATAGLGRGGPLNYSPPWRPRGFLSFQGLGGSASRTITVDVRAVQRTLIAKGFNVGRTGADGTWGTASLSAYSSALGVEQGYALGAPQGPRGSQTITMPEEYWLRLNQMPNRAAGTGSGGGGASREQPAAPTPTAPRPTPSTEPIVEPDQVDTGFAMPEWAPYAIGGAALLGLGGFFLWQGRKKRSRAATPAPVAANRRRSRRRR